MAHLEGDTPIQTMLPVSSTPRQSLDKCPSSSTSRGCARDNISHIVAQYWPPSSGLYSVLFIMCTGICISHAQFFSRSKSCRCAEKMTHNGAATAELTPPSEQQSPPQRLCSFPGPSTSPQHPKLCAAPSILYRPSRRQWSHASTSRWCQTVHRRRCRINRKSKVDSPAAPHRAN